MEDSSTEHITMPALLDITERESCSPWDTFEQMTLLSIVAIRRANSNLMSIEDERASDKKKWISERTDLVVEIMNKMREQAEGLRDYL